MSYGRAAYMDADDIADLRAEVLAQRRYHRKFLAAPDCRDPDHPGCPSCMGNDDDQDDEE